MKIPYVQNEVVSDVELKNNGELHRFTNCFGVPFSAIYQNGIEIFSCEREREAGMVEYWNKMPD